MRERKEASARCPQFSTPVYEQMIGSVDNVGVVPTGAHVVPFGTNTLSPISLSSNGG